ncbi:MAG: hypothetical protein RIA62_04245 [Cyclobacteriaceae bacterium]
MSKYKEEQQQRTPKEFLLEVKDCLPLNVNDKSGPHLRWVVAFIFDNQSKYPIDTL